MKTFNENSFSYKFLIKLGELLDLGITFLIWDFKKISKIVGMGSLTRGPLDRLKLSKSLYVLKRGGYIKETKIKRKKKIQLTQKGRMEIIKYKIKIKIKKPKWDGKWRAICWDVPEVSRKDRNYLRSKLRWLGFKELQKSLWVFPFDVKNEVKELIRLYKEELAGDVRFLTIEKIEKDEDLRKYFNLK